MGPVRYSNAPVSITPISLCPVAFTHDSDYNCCFEIAVINNQLISEEHS